MIFTKALAFLKFISEEKIDEPAKWQEMVHNLVVASVPAAPALSRALQANASANTGDCGQPGSCVSCSGACPSWDARRRSAEQPSGGRAPQPADAEQAEAAGGSL